MTTNWLRALSCLVPAVVLAAGCGGSGEGEGVVGDVGTAKEALAPAGSNAHFVSTALLPGTLVPGERRLVQVTMQNNGAASPANDWKTAGPAYALSAVNGSWGWSYSYVPSTVAVGLSNTFTFAITAPPTSQSFTARMSAVGQGVFGDTVTVPVTMNPAGTPQWGCTYVSASSTLPTTIAPGASQFVTVTVRNTGSDAWTPGSAFSLRSQDTPANFWNQTNATLASPVAPGATGSFSFSIKAPVTPGTYSFTREMFNANQMGLFRSYGFCVSVPITVGGPLALDATINSQNFPTTMAPSEVAPVVVKMNNTGTETWLADGNYMLYSLSSPTNLWGVTQSNVATATVQNGVATFNFSVTAPAATGSYTQKWQMRKVSGTNAGFFGAIISVPVTVSGSATPTYGATVVSQNVPTLVTAGKTYTFVVTMQNSGTAIWSGSNFVLSSTSTPSNTWGITQSALGAAEMVGQNQTRPFNLFVTAPAAAGTYASSWRMRNATTVGYFGQTALTNVQVTLCGNNVINAGEDCDDNNLTNGDGCSNLCKFEQIVDDLATGGTSERTVEGNVAAAQVSPVTIGDVTGDGVPDVMISSGVQIAGTGSKGGAGSVYGYLGGAGFLNASTTVIPTGSGFQIAGADANDALAAVANGRMVVGQIVGDATQDLVVSAPGADGASNGRSNCGEVYVIQGGSALGSAGLINLGAATMPSQVTAHIIGKNAGDALVVLGIGELTGDASNDLVLGAPGDPTNGAGAGAIYIVSGGSLSGDIDLAAPPGGVVVFRILGEGASGAFGAMGRAALGDLNGDGRLDILSGAVSMSPGGRTRAGTAYASFGPFGTNKDYSQGVGSGSGPSVKWLGQNNFDGFGSSVAIGNVTGTAGNEAVIGAIQYEKSGVQVGGVSIWSAVSATTYDLSAGATPTSLILGADANDDCGSSVALGNVNNDGFLDIAFGCSTADGVSNARSSAGEVHVVLGAASLPVTYDMTVRRSNYVIYGADSGGQIARHPSSLAIADLDGNGKADICAGAYLSLIGSVRAGRVDCLLSGF